jgi:hypothetical protein
MSNKKKDPLWLTYEKTIASYLQALDPSAHVVHNVLVPDKDTGLPRQRDVIIDSQVAGFKISIYVSCKDYKRKINQQDMDAVIGELASSGANKGVIYARNGFGKAAQEKAKAHNIDCCVLINDASIVIPEELNLNFYARRGRVSFNFGIQDRREQMNFIGSRSLNPKGRVVVILAKELNRIVRQSCNNNYIAVGSTIEIEVSPGVVVPIKLHHSWDYYTAKLSTKLINGSYNLTQQQFNGTVTSPMIDISTPDMGEQWTKLDSPPTDETGYTIQIEPEYREFWKSLTKEKGWKYSEAASDTIFE